METYIENHCEYYKLPQDFKPWYARVRSEAVETAFLRFKAANDNEWRKLFAFAEHLSKSNA